MEGATTATLQLSATERQTQQLLSKRARAPVFHSINVSVRLLDCSIYCYSHVGHHKAPLFFCSLLSPLQLGHLLSQSLILLLKNDCLRLTSSGNNHVMAVFSHETLCNIGQSVLYQNLAKRCKLDRWLASQDVHKTVYILIVGSRC
jgi:hypothetical protein